MYTLVTVDDQYSPTFVREVNGNEIVNTTVPSERIRFATHDDAIAVSNRLYLARGLYDGVSVVQVMYYAD